MGKNEYNFLMDPRFEKIEKARAEIYKISSAKIDKEMAKK